MFEITLPLRAGTRAHSERPSGHKYSHTLGRALTDLWGPLIPNASSILQLKTANQQVEQKGERVCSSSGLLDERAHWWVLMKTGWKKQSALHCSSWADTVAAPGTREGNFGKAAVQPVEEITFLTTKAKSETAYLPELSATRSNILPGQTLSLVTSFTAFIRFGRHQSSTNIITAVTPCYF